MELEDNHEREGAPEAGEGEGLSYVETPYAEAAEAAADSLDQMHPSSPSNRPTLERTASKEDTFVDCPDEIEISESLQNSEEKDNLEDAEADESDSGVKVPEMIAEIEFLRDKLEKNVSEKEHLAQKYEGERAELINELSHLCHQLKVSNEKNITAGYSGDGFIDNHQNEVVTLDAALGSRASLHEIISECSRLLKTAMDERQQTEEKVMELHSVLHSKDQEIDFLNAKVAELTESSNIAQSIANAEHDNLSQLYEARFQTDQHMEETANRILASLTMVHHPEQPWDRSLIEKFSEIEKSVAFIVEKYNIFVYGSDQLKGCLNEVGLDLDQVEEIGAFELACNKILELRRKEDGMYQKASNLEYENRNLVEQLEKQKSTLENMNAEIRRLGVEVEQEKNRCANTKEKLSMAVTKGKALVQKRDSLTQLLLEKTSELERCSIELQEKSTALEAAERANEMIATSEKLAASLQESLAEKEAVLQKCGEILSESLTPNELQPTDIVDKIRWFADENKSLKDISLQYHKLSDLLFSFDFPETVASSDLDVRVRWLAESSSSFKEEAINLQFEIAKTIEAANGRIEHLTTSLLAEIQEKHNLQAELEDLSSKCEAHERLQNEQAEARQALNNEIDHLTSSLLTESQEKSHLQLELENLRQQYEGVMEKNHQFSLEKDEMVRILLEASGLANDGDKEVHPDIMDTSTIIDYCVAKIRENAGPFEPSLEKMDFFESFKSLLYIRDLEMTLYKLIIEEGMSDRARVSHLSEELKMKTQELNVLKDEKAVMQKSLDQLEDRCALLKDKLSMAVKKGKGLVQERENLKSSLNERNAEIDNLKSELQQYLSKYDESQDQVSKLLVEMERISLLERDLVSTKEHADQLENFLAESNSMLQRVMESIEGITTPTDQVPNDPLDKVKWVAGYLSENEISKTQMEQELRSVNDEVSSLSGKLSEAQTVIKSLEDALTIVENSRSELLDEKKELEVSKALLEEELRKEKEKDSSQTSKYEELLVSKKALEDALLIAEENASRFMNERDVAIEGRSLVEQHLNEFEVSKALLEEELQKGKEEASSHTSKYEELLESKKALEDAILRAEENASRFMNERDIAVEGRYLVEKQLNELKEELSDYVRKLADADKSIQSLEDALSQAQTNISLLAEENSKVQNGQDDLDGEIRRIREEADLLAGKLSEASITIKSLEDASVSAQNNMADMVQKNRNAEMEINELTSKLESCMEELSATQNKTQNRSLELSGQLGSLQFLLKDETFSTLLGQCFRRKFESLKSIDFLLTETLDCSQEMESDVQQNIPIMENDPSLPATLPSNIDITPNMEMLNDEVNAVDDENVVDIDQMVKKYHLKNKILADHFDNLSTLMDESMEALLRRLYLTKDKIVHARKYTSSLKDRVKVIETDKTRQEDVIASLESDIRILLSACTDATHGLVLNAHKVVPVLRTINELVHIDGIMSMDMEADSDDAATALATDHVKKAEKLLLATRRNQDLSILFQDAISKLMDMTENMQNKLKETQLTYDEILEERDQCKDKFLKLESDLKEQHNFHNDMTMKLEDVQSKLKETQLTCDEALEEREVYKDKILKLETDLREQQDLYHDMTAQLDHHRKKDELREREAELSTSFPKSQELETLSAYQVKSVLEKVSQIDVPDAAFANGDSHDSANVRKLFYLIDSFRGSVEKVSSLSHQNEELRSTIDKQILEMEQLRRQDEDYIGIEKDSEKMNQLLELESGLQLIARKLGANDVMDDPKVNGGSWLLPLLEKLITAVMHESETLKLKNEDLGAKLLGAQKAVDDLSNKVKLLEESNQSRVILPEIDQERGTSEAFLSTQSEISEMQDAAPLANSNNVPSVSSAAHVRTLRKGSTDHLAINIESESERLIDDKGSDEDKGHAFKPLITSGLVPMQGRAFADRIDGIWVSGSRALMSHPRGRLGFVAYWLVLHIWLLGTIL